MWKYEKWNAHNLRTNGDDDFCSLGAHKNMRRLTPFVVHVDTRHLCVRTLYIGAWGFVLVWILLASFVGALDVFGFTATRCKLTPFSLRALSEVFFGRAWNAPSHQSFTFCC
jgi:hypothetical protein